MENAAMNNDVDQYAQQKSLFGDEPTIPHPKGFREELHAREKDNIPNPNRHPGQFAPKGGSNPLLKVVEHEHGWTASAMLKDGKEFRVEGKDRREAIGNAIRAGERMGVIFDPPAAEPKIGGLFGGSFDEKAHPREQKNHDGKQAGQFAPKHQAEEVPFVLQRPKKNTTVPSFGSNTNTKQSALFDVGKKNELPGQELLFNSDAGDLHNPKTMENKVATSESKSQPDPMAIAQEALSNNENIGITMGRHGVTIKEHPDYRTIRKQVSKHLEELQEQAKPKPSPARQRAMDAQMARSQEPQPTPQVKPKPLPDGKVRMKQAKAGGETSDVDGKFYKGGRLMPVHGLYSGREKPNPKPKPENPFGSLPVANEDGKGLPSARKRTDEQIEQERKEMQDKAAWLSVQSGPVRDMVWVGDKPGKTAYEVKKQLVPFLSGLNDEQVQQIGEFAFQSVIDHESEQYPDVGRESIESEFNGHAAYTADLLLNKKIRKEFPSMERTVEAIRQYSGLPDQLQRWIEMDEHLRDVLNVGSSAEEAEPAVKYSKAYEQFEEEAERYFRDYTLYDVDRYGMGGGIMKLILSMMAMHAMSSMINNQSQARQQKQKPSAAAPTTPSNQDFEKLHPRAQTQSGNSKPGQFAKKPEVQKQQSPPPRQVRPLTERPDKKTQLSQAPPTQQQQQQQEQPAPVTPKPWLAEPGSPKPDVTAYDLDPRRGTPEQKAAAMQSRMDRDAGAPQQPVQTPSNPNTARIAEIWHGKESGQADDFGAGIDDPPQVQPQQPQPLKTEPAGLNPRKKTLGDGMTPNPAYNPQQINPPDLPAKPPRQKPEKAPKPEKAQKPEKPSLLDREESAPASNADIFENPAAKARREKAELDRITKFDVNEFGSGIEQPDAPVARPTIQSVQGDYTALEAARNERAKQVRAFTNWENTTQKNPETNIADVASEHELDHEPFSNYAKEMQAFEESEWKRREGVKTAIRKAWKVDGGDLKQMENRNQDHSNLQRGDELKGSVDDSDLYEFLGNDEGEWSQNAWAMLREDPPERPGAHSKDWLHQQAEDFKRYLSMTQPETDLYPEPEDGMPFSRKSLTREIDRYFRQHLSQIRATRAKTESQSWTELDSWL